MMKPTLFYQNLVDLIRPARGRRGAGVLLAGAALVWGLLAWGCGRVLPLPASIEPQDYREITYDQLLHPDTGGLKAGDKVKVPAYFWQYVDYDPDMVRDYLNLMRHPLSWPKLKWFALYGSPELKGYYDRAALDKDREKLYPVHRLEPVMVYGQLSPLGPGLYLHVHHLEKIAED
jgi:hypothetical protein